MRIWDLHCHLSGVPGLTPEERMGQLLRYADRMGVERLCVYMGMQGSQDPSPDDLVKQNDEVLRAMARYPDRMFGFVSLSAKHVERSVAEIERCVAGGPMVGVKLWVAQRCNVPEIDPIDLDGARGRIVEPEQQAQDGAFAGTAASHEGNMRSALDLEAYARKARCSDLVAEGDVAKRDRPCEPRQSERLLRILHGRVLCQKLLDAREAARGA